MLKKVSKEKAVNLLQAGKYVGHPKTGKAFQKKEEVIRCAAPYFLVMVCKEEEQGKYNPKKVCTMKELGEENYEKRLHKHWIERCNTFCS